MYNPRESLKTATSIGIAGLGVATLGFGGLGALLLGGAALGAGATGINSLIDPERPYKVEKRERKESAPLTPEDKKRYDERADKIVDGIETFLGGAKSLGKYSLKYSAKAVISPFKYSFKGVRAAKKLVDKVVKEKREKKRQEGWKKIDEAIKQKRIYEADFNSEPKEGSNEYEKSNRLVRGVRLGEIVLSSYSGKKQKEPDWKQAVKDMRKKAYESETAQASDKTPGYIARFNQMIRDLGEGSLAKGYLKASLTGWKMIGKETMSDIKKEIGFTREGLTKSFEGLSYIAKKGVKLGKTVDDVFERGVKIKIENKGLENLLRRFSRSDGTSELEEESLEEVEDTIKPAGLVSRTYQRTQEIGRGLMETSAGYRDRLKTMGNGSYLKGLNEVRKSVQEIIGESLQSGGQRLKGMGDGSYLKGSLELGRQIYLNIKESRTSIEEPFTEEWTEKQEKEWEDLAGRMDRGEKLRLKERNRLVNLDGNREYILEKKTEEEGESEREANEPSLEEKVVNDGLDALRNYIPDDESLGDFQRGERSQKEMPGKTRLGKIPQMEILNQGEIDQLPEYIKDGKEGDETPKIEDEDLTERKKSSQDAGSQFAKELEARFGDGATGDTTPQEESSGGDNELEKRLSDVMTQANTDAEDYSKSLNGMLGEEFKDDNYTTGESDEPTLSEEEFEEDMARLTPEEREEWDGLRRIDPWDMNDRQFNRYSELVEKKNDRQNST